MEEFRVTLMKVAENLNGEELQKLKYLCMGKIPKQRCEAANSIEMMELLEQNNLVSPGSYNFLVDFLSLVQRKDLLQLLPGFPELPKVSQSECLPFPQQERRKNNQDDNEVRRIISNVAKRIVKDWKMVVRSLGVCDDDIDCIVHDNSSSILEQAYQGLLKWYQLNRDRTSEDLLESLAEVLNKKGRKDIADDIRDRSI